MNRTIWIIALALTVLLTGTAWAGHGSDHAKADKEKVAHAKADCPEDMETCLTKMVAKYKAQGWFGIETEKLDEGYYAKVTKVIPGSPAEAAGMQAGDILLALNGVELKAENKEALKKVKQSLRVGAQATYTVKRQGGKAKVAVTLGEVPTEVMAAWIGYHMLEAHAPVRVAAAN